MYKRQGLERSCDDCFKAQYMQRHIGEVFDGVISAVASYGFYVALESGVEGLVPVSYTHLDPDRLVAVQQDFAQAQQQVELRLALLQVEVDPAP